MVELNLPEPVMAEVHGVLEEQARVTDIDYSDPDDDYKRVITSLIGALRSDTVELSDRQAEALLYELRVQKSLTTPSAAPTRMECLQTAIEALEAADVEEIGPWGENE